MTTPTKPSASSPSKGGSPKRNQVSPGKGPVYMGKQQPHASKMVRPVVPGPGTYDSQSSCGTQSASVNKSAASFGFGTSSRMGSTKQYLSAKHSKVAGGGTETKNVDFITKSGMGTQAESSRPSSQGWSSPRAQRASYERTYAGPAHARSMGGGRNTTQVDYMNSGTSSVKEQASSTKKTAPNHTFPKQHRSAYQQQYLSKAAQSKMPNGNTKNVDFTDKSSMGPMAESGKKTGSSNAFPRSTRDDYNNVYDSKAQADKKMNLTTKDVDYLPHGVESSVNKQANGTKKSAPSFTIDKSNRDTINKQFVGKEFASKMINENTAHVDYPESTAAHDKTIAAAIGFGTSNREHSSRLHMGKFLMH
jgi:hypothetical protein